MKWNFGDLVAHRVDAGKFNLMGIDIWIETDKKIEIEMKDQLSEAIDMLEY